MSITSRLAVAAGIVSAAVTTVAAVGVPAQAAAPDAATPAPLVTKVIDYPSFKRGPNLHLNGSTMIAPGTGMAKPAVLRLTNSKAHQAGTAWSSVPINVTKQSFTSTFVVHNQGTGVHGDGMAFVVHSAGKKALGFGGGAMGYANIKPALAVEFDTYKNAYDPNANHISVMTGGKAETPVVTKTSPVALFGKPFRATVAYDAKTKMLRVSLLELGKQGPAVQVLATKYDLPTLLGVKPVLMGFSGGTGSNVSTQDVRSWTVTLTK